MRLDNNNNDNVKSPNETDLSHPTHSEQWDGCSPNKPVRVVPLAGAVVGAAPQQTQHGDNGPPHLAGMNGTCMMIRSSSQQLQTQVF